MNTQTSKPQRTLLLASTVSLAVLSFLLPVGWEVVQRARAQQGTKGPPPIPGQSSAPIVKPPKDKSSATGSRLGYASFEDEADAKKKGGAATKAGGDAWQAITPAMQPVDPKTGTPGIPVAPPWDTVSTDIPNTLPKPVMAPAPVQPAPLPPSEPNLIQLPTPIAPVPQIEPKLFQQPSPIAPVAAWQEPPKALPVQPKPEVQPVIPLPPPRTFPPFGPDQVRTPLLGDPSAEPLGTTPRPTQKEIEEYAKYVTKFIDPNNTLDLIEARARLMIIKDVPKRIQISDESVVGYTQISPKEMSLLGKKPGTTVLNLWFTSVDDKTKETVLSYLVRVFPDPMEKERLERVFKALEKELNKQFPDSIVRLSLVGDKVVVSGQAHDIEQASQILKIVISNTPGAQPATAATPNATKAPSPAIVPTLRPDVADWLKGATPGMENYITSGSDKVINMMRVAGVQQVMLKVVVAEVNRTAARSIGLNFSVRNDQGITVVENRTGGLLGTGLGGGGGGLLGAAGGLANIPVNLDNGQVTLAIHALKRMNYAKSLAEPTLTTLNGQPATFLAGGQFPVPFVAGNAVGGLQGVNFVPFGVQLFFTPIVTDKDRIRLYIGATVSTRDTATGANFSGTQVPGLNARNFSSTVEMRDGQTLAVAGLLQTNHGTDRDNLPFLGTIPVINRLTGVDRTSAGEQELVILVTPELVQPMHAQQLPRLPGSDLFEASDLEFYLLGRLEGRRPVDFRSPVMNEFHRIRQYNRVEQQYIFGPTGYYREPGIPGTPK